VVIDDLQEHYGMLYSDTDERRIFAQPWNMVVWDEKHDDTGVFARSETLRSAVEDSMLQLRYEIDSPTQVIELQHHWETCQLWHRLAWRQYMYTKVYSGLVGILPLVWKRDLEGYHSSPFDAQRLFAEHVAFAMYSHRLIQDVESAYTATGESTGGSRGTCRARRREHRRTATSGGVYEIRLRQYTSTAGTSTAGTSTTGTGSQEELWTKSTSIHRGTERTSWYQIYEYRSISTTGIWYDLHNWSSTT
jgi:hypothetical protein